MVKSIAKIPELNQKRIEELSADIDEYSTSP